MARQSGPKCALSAEDSRQQTARRPFGALCCAAHSPGAPKRSFRQIGHQVGRCFRPTGPCFAVNSPVELMKIGVACVWQYCSTAACSFTLQFAAVFAVQLSAQSAKHKTRTAERRVQIGQSSRCGRTAFASVHTKRTERAQDQHCPRAQTALRAPLRLGCGELLAPRLSLWAPSVEMEGRVGDESRRLARPDPAERGGGKREKEGRKKEAKGAHLVSGEREISQFVG